jgi:hypothetical protein
MMMMMMIGNCLKNSIYNLLGQVRSTCGSWAICCMLSAATFVMRTICLAKPRQNAEATLKSCELFIYGNIH